MNFDIGSLLIDSVENFEEGENSTACSHVAF